MNATLMLFIGFAAGVVVTIIVVEYSIEKTVDRLYGRAFREAMFESLENHFASRKKDEKHQD